MTVDTELAVIITVPDGAKQVLVRIPGDSDDVTVDFRDSYSGVWTPSVFFPASVDKHLQ